MFSFDETILNLHSLFIYSSPVSQRAKLKRISQVVFLLSDLTKHNDLWFLNGDN